MRAVALMVPMVVKRGDHESIMQKVKSASGGGCMKRFLAICVADEKMYACYLAVRDVMLVVLMVVKEND